MVRVISGTVLALLCLLMLAVSNGNSSQSVATIVSIANARCVRYQNWLLFGVILSPELSEQARLAIRAQAALSNRSVKFVTSTPESFAANKQWLQIKPQFKSENRTFGSINANGTPIVFVQQWVANITLSLGLLPGLVMLGRRYLSWRQPAKGHCRQCGYNLTGNESGACSECGTALESHGQ